MPILKSSFSIFLKNYYFEGTNKTVLPFYHKGISLLNRKEKPFDLLQKEGNLMKRKYRDVSSIIFIEKSKGKTFFSGSTISM